MRLNRGDRIAGVDGLRLRNYFRRYSENVNCRTLMEEFSMSKRRAQDVLDALLKLKMISPFEFQHGKKMVRYETTILGNALGMAKAGRSVKRASAGTVLRELLDRVKAINDRQDLAYRVESVVVFGSYLSKAKRVNDLDVAVELKPRSTDDATWERLCNTSHERAEAAGRRFRNVVEQVGWPQLEVLGILKNRSRTISFCEWNSLLRMEDLRYCAVFGDKERIAGLLKGGQATELPRDDSSGLRQRTDLKQVRP
jgi:predicted nucleotidyltransferase